MLSIVDQSFTTQDQKLKCLLFAKEENKLPPAQVGDVIRFHRLSVSFRVLYKNNIKEKEKEIDQLLLFVGTVDLDIFFLCLLCIT